MIIFESGAYRIRTERDLDISIDDMKGEMFLTSSCPDIDPEELKKQEKEYEDNLYIYGAYGVILEQWNPEVGAGWQEIDSCWGFENWGINLENGFVVDPNYDTNDAVQEFKDIIKRGRS